MARLYQTQIFPRLMDKNIGKPEIVDYRRRLLQNASGNMLEIGIGTGLNLNLYPNTITEITAVDPFVRKLPSSRILVKLYPETAEQMHFEDSTFDTVLSTFTFCSVSNLPKTLKEIARVLKPDGRLLFLEHGRADTRFAQQLQKVANPFYNIFACGCSINRDYKQVLSEAGFGIEKYNLYKVNIYPKILTGYLYEGVAKNDKQQRAI